MRYHSSLASTYTLSLFCHGTGNYKEGNLRTSLSGCSHASWPETALNCFWLRLLWSVFSHVLKPPLGPSHLFINSLTLLMSNVGVLMGLHGDKLHLPKCCVSVAISRGHEAPEGYWQFAGCGPSMSVVLQCWPGPLISFFAPLKSWYFRHWAFLSASVCLFVCFWEGGAFLGLFLGFSVLQKESLNLLKERRKSHIFYLLTVYWKKPLIFGFYIVYTWHPKNSKSYIKRQSWAVHGLSALALCLAAACLVSAFFSKNWFRDLIGTECGVWVYMEWESPSILGSKEIILLFFYAFFQTF